MSRINGELLDHLSYKVDRTKNMANIYLAYPDFVLDKFSGADPNQVAEFFVQSIEERSTSHYRMHL